MAEKEEECVAIEVLVLTLDRLNFGTESETRTSSLRHHCIAHQHNLLGLSAPASLHFPFLTTSANLNQYRYLALPGTVSKLGLPARVKSLRTIERQTSPKKASHVALNMILLFLLVSYMKRFYQSWIERPKSEFK